MDKPARPSLEISATEAQAQACPMRPLLDIRTARERQAGAPVGAVPMSLAELRDQCRNAEPETQRRGFVICAEGVRSLKLVRQLAVEGFEGFHSVTGGFLAWQQAGLPVSSPTGLDALQAQRYARHLVMPQVGPQGQHQLLDSGMLLVGLGGLNSPATLYLAAAGVGRLGLVDDDRVERSNLQRQVIYGESALGLKKVVSASGRISDLNPDTETVLIDRRIDDENAGDIIRDWDIIIDGTDNFPARYALNEACVRQSKPLVYGAVMRFQGQVAVFWPATPESGRERPPCFRCLMPAAPAPQDAPACSEAGVLGVLPGIVGTLQATEALKLALGIGRPLIGRLLMIDALTMDFREARIRANPACPTCGAV